jgi:GNAT superfamily N-acetyltransferase
MPDISIRPAALSDSPAIARLVGQLGYASSEAQIRDRLAVLSGRTDYAVWVAEIPGRIVGLVGVFVHYGLEFDGAYGRLLGLVVDEAFRGKGIGRRLMGQTERWLQERGVRHLTLTSGKQRKEAHAFYRRLGFEETGLRFKKDI